MIDNSIPVRAYDFETGEFIGEFESISKAARRLFIRAPETIYSYIFGKSTSTFKGKRKGVKSYKDGRRYSFELVNKKAA